MNKPKVDPNWQRKFGAILNVHVYDMCDLRVRVHMRISLYDAPSCVYTYISVYVDVRVECACVYDVYVWVYMYE